VSETYGTTEGNGVGDLPPPNVEEIETAEDLRAYLAALMTARRTIRALESDTGVSKTTLAEIRRGERRPSREVVAKIVGRYAPDEIDAADAAWVRVQPVTAPPPTETNGNGHAARPGILVRPGGPRLPDRLWLDPRVLLLILIGLALIQIMLIIWILVKGPPRPPPPPSPPVVRIDPGTPTASPEPSTAPPSEAPPSARPSGPPPSGGPPPGAPPPA
jgi:transcriptional regulator with XRE-family HTH domain